MSDQTCLFFYSLSTKEKVCTFETKSIVQVQYYKSPTGISVSTAFSGGLPCHFNGHARLGTNGKSTLELSVCISPVASSPNRQYRSNGLLRKRGNLRSPDIPAEVALAGEQGDRSRVL